MVWKVIRRATEFLVPFLALPFRRAVVLPNIKKSVFFYLTKDFDDILNKTICQFHMKKALSKFISIIFTVHLRYGLNLSAAA